PLPLAFRVYVSSRPARSVNSRYLVVISVRLLHACPELGLVLVLALVLVRFHQIGKSFALTFIHQLVVLQDPRGLVRLPLAMKTCCRSQSSSLPRLVSLSVTPSGRTSMRPSFSRILLRAIDVSRSTSHVRSTNSRLLAIASNIVKISVLLSIIVPLFET